MATKKITLRIPNELLEEIEATIRKTVLINTCIVFYKQLLDISVNEPDKYAVGETFFNSVSVSYDYLIICELAKMFNTNEERGNIHNIFKNVRLLSNSKAENRLFSTDECLTSIENTLKDVDIIDIKTYRDKFFTHGDTKYFDNPLKLTSKYEFDLDRFEELNKLAHDILTTLYNVVSLYNTEYKVFGINLVSRYDLYNIVDKI